MPGAQSRGRSVGRSSVTEGEEHPLANQIKREQSREDQTNEGARRSGDF